MKPPYFGYFDLDRKSDAETFDECLNECGGNLEMFFPIEEFIHFYHDEDNNYYQAEIRNLNLKVGRRDEKIEKMNEALTETQKELQAVRDEKSILEKKLQEIQET